jgi:hypothetical protein
MVALGSTTSIESNLSLSCKVQEVQETDLTSSPSSGTRLFAQIGSMVARSLCCGSFTLGFDLCYFRKVEEKRKLQGTTVGGT